ncbi:uncharacterized protein LOC125442905 [Sphaerodactylus townsendi]|uniref:uncharacterized protein LOC125442905 n=1 Tax=Sphaerodactylus townsendi TaxID=933632 RepID=UPI0020264BD2|nr:uncharacterized protein LOC125442905 [Sphaerodactylus townsendi]
MRRRSGLQSAGSFLEPLSQLCLSPMSQTEPGQEAPSFLYRSFFAQECDAVVSQLSRAANERRPRCVSTVQDETLTPLESPSSFLESPDGGSSPRPVPEPASAGFGPPDRSAAGPFSEQSPSLAGASPGAGAQPIATSPGFDLVGASSRPEREKDSPPPSVANITYDCMSSGGSADATYLCTGSTSPGKKEMAVDAAPAHPGLEVCGQLLPIVTSTPLMVPPRSKDAPPTTEGPLNREGSAPDSWQKSPEDPLQEATFRVSFTSSHESLPAAARNGANQVPRVSGKIPLAKRSLALRARGAQGIGGLPRGTGVMKKILQSAGGYNFRNFLGPPEKSGSAIQSQPVVQKLLPDEITKADLTELPCNKKPPISIQPPSKLAGRSGVQGSLACLGLKPHSLSRDTSATRLPGPAGNKTTTKSIAAIQKRPPCGQKPIRQNY